MLIEATKYKLRKNHNRLAVMVGKKIEAHGFDCEDSALHAVWTLENQPKDVTFSVTEVGNVLRNTPVKSKL